MVVIIISLPKLNLIAKEKEPEIEKEDLFQGGEQTRSTEERFKLIYGRREELYLVRVEP